MAEATTNAKVGKPDTYILGIYITLLVISVVESYSASSREIKNDLMEPMVRQLTYLAFGVVTMIACSRINYTKYVNYGNVFSLFAIGLMLFAAFFGKTSTGRNVPCTFPASLYNRRNSPRLQSCFCCRW